MVKGKEKGNSYEWEVARRLSLWLSHGASNKEFVRSIQSGGWEGQYGDLAANDTHGIRFLRRFTVECKHHRVDPDFWHVFSSSNPILLQWWLQAVGDAAESQTHLRQTDRGDIRIHPLLFIKRNHRPEIVVVPRMYCPIPEAAVRSMQLELQAGAINTDVDEPSYEVNIFSVYDLVRTDPEWIYENWI